MNEPRSVRLQPPVWAPCLPDGELPRLFRIRQAFDRTRVDDVASATRAALAGLSLPSLPPGARVAITAGSRGIAHLPVILRTLVDLLRGRGADPFLVPAMGSHGGATAEGQVAVLASLGITEESVGAPIRSSMEVVQVGEILDGLPVCIDRIAAAADRIVVVNRIKPHTKFKGPIESGLMKMLAIGLGKRHGAELYHRAAMQHGFPRILVEAGRLILRAAPILCGIGIVENAYDETAAIEGALPAEIESKEERWLQTARKLMPRLPFPEIDLLIVDEIGKEISGVGLDPNITGRNRDQLGTFPHPVRVRYLFVRDLTPETKGNAVGIGLADLTTRRLVEAIDLNTTCANCATSVSLEKAAIPLFFETDREAVSLALSSLGLVEPRQARVIRIRSTLHLGEVMVSEAFQEELASRPDLSVIHGPDPLGFDSAGNLGPVSREDALPAAVAADS